MGVPDYQSLMLPLLKTLADGKEHRLQEIRELLAIRLQLSQDDLLELLPSGTTLLFNNRVGWAQTYLKKAGLLNNPRRAVLVITDRGRSVLANPPASIDTAFLAQYPEFQQFVGASGGGAAGETQMLSPPASTELETPEELLETAYQKLREELASDLLTTIKNNSPAFFERLVVDLLVHMGYGGSRREAGKAVGQSGDEGIDGIIKEDRLGLDAIYIQAKRWTDKSVGRPDVQSFAGALQGLRAKKGIFITTSYFTREAHDYAERLDTKIILIDGGRLADLMIENNVGVMPVANYEIKRIDLDFFSQD